MTMTGDEDDEIGEEANAAGSHCRYSQRSGVDHAGSEIYLPTQLLFYTTLENCNLQLAEMHVVMSRWGMAVPAG